MRKCDFRKSSKPTLMKSHFRMGVPLKICCTFAEQLFWRTPMGNYFCKFLFNMPAIFFNTNSCQIGLFSNIFLTRSMFSSERAVLRFSEFSLFLFRVIPCEEYFVTFCWIVFLKGGAWLNRCRNATWTVMQFFSRKIFLQQNHVLFRYLRHFNPESPLEKEFSNHFYFRAI